MKRWKAAMYLRLSRDDGTNLESLSITNQKIMLEDWLKDKTDIDLIDCYIDDGYTGTNFDRPGFNDLMFDIKIKRIDCVIVKDLSRLGRNSSKTSHLIDEFFPQNGIRFISINDGMDTLGLVDDNDITCFKLVCNEFYVKDISKKTKSGKMASAKKGNFIGSYSAYGYKKDEEDYHKLVIDEYAANIVKQIFKDYAHGDSGRKIADKLNTNGVLTPYNYRNNCLGLEVDKSKFWTSSTILQILHNEVYFGNMVQHKRESVSYKLPLRRIIDKSEHIVCNNTHEPIIEKDLELAVKNRFKNQHSKNRRENKEGKVVPVKFSGLLRCYDCGSKMPATIMNKKRCYRCYNYLASGSSACSTHFVYEEDIEKYVMDDIKSLIKRYKNNPNAFINEIKYNACTNTSIMINEVKKKRDEFLKTIENIKSKMFDLYNDKNNLSASMFSVLAKQYDDKLQESLQEMEKYDNILANNKYDDDNINNWLHMLLKIDSFDVPNFEYYHSVVDKILVKSVGEKDRFIIKYKVGFLNKTERVNSLNIA